MPSVSLRLSRVAGATALVASMAVGAACSSDVQPSASAPPAAIIAPTTFVELRGQVWDTAFNLLSGVTVEVVGGPSAGRSASSGNSPLFSLMVPAGQSVTLRLSRDGFAPHILTMPAPAQAAQLTQFFLAPAGSPARVPSGPYVLQFMMDGDACGDVPGLQREVGFAATLQDYSTAPTGSMQKVLVERGGATSFTSWMVLGAAGDRIGLIPFSDPLFTWNYGTQYFSANPVVEGAVWNPGGGRFSFPARFDYGTVQSVTPFLAWYDMPASSITGRGHCDGRVVLEAR